MYYGDGDGVKPTALGALFSVFAAAALRGGVSTLISRTRCLIPTDRFRVPPQFGQGRGLRERLKQVQFFKAHRSICGARGDDAVWSATADRRCASHLDNAKRASRLFWGGDFGPLWDSLGTTSWVIPGSSLGDSVSRFKRTRVRGPNGIWQWTCFLYCRLKR